MKDIHPPKTEHGRKSDTSPLDDVHAAPYAAYAERILADGLQPASELDHPLHAVLGSENLPIDPEGYNEREAEEQLGKMLDQFSDNHIKEIQEKNGIDLTACRIEYDNNRKSYVIRDQNGSPITKLDMERIAFNENELYLPPCLLDLIELDFSRNDIGEVKDLPRNIEILATGARRVINLPPSLKKLRFRGDILPDSLPETLEAFDCQISFLRKLPVLPDSLIELNCADIVNLGHIADTLPPKLETLICWGSYLSSLPKLPDSLKVLHCSKNFLKSLPDLPPKLESLRCRDNHLTDLPRLPRSINSAIDWGGNPMNEKTVSRIWEEIRSL